MGKIRLLTWSRSQLFRKWPKCIIPANQTNTQTSVSFTKMMTNIKSKAYDYSQMLKPVQQKFNQQLKYKQFTQKSLLLQNNKQFQVQIQVGDNQQKPQNIQKSQHASQNIKNEQKQKLQFKNQSLHQSNIQSIKTSDIIAQEHFSPFLPNYDNPFDRNANTKILKHKFDRIKLDSGKRNIAALIENQKKSKQTNQNYKFGKSVPKKATDSIDINDILKYTLGLKRQRQVGQKPEPIKNPFVRVPPKYYESMGDFYNSSKK